MFLGIDASNIRIGGGLVHLKAILRHGHFEEYGISRVVVWGTAETLKDLPEHEQVLKISLHNKTTSPLRRIVWQSYLLGDHASQLGCDLLFIPGSLYLGRFRPFVAMLQNMQVFEWRELRREGFSTEGLRLLALQVLQGFTLLRSDGVILLSDYCLTYVEENWKWLIKRPKTTVIPHGIDHPGRKRAQRPIEAYTDEAPFRILYVSTVKMYKHQWNLVAAVAKLRRQGFPLHLDLVGGGDKAATAMLRRAIERNAMARQFVFYHGHQTHEATRRFFEESDLFAFPSTCETFGISLLEAMSYGLPIACSSYGPMPEVLDGAGLYFDPLDPDSVAETLRALILDVNLRKELSAAAAERAKLYSWRASARKTFEFLSEVSRAV